MEKQKYATLGTLSLAFFNNTNIKSPVWADKKIPCTCRVGKLIVIIFFRITNNFGLFIRIFVRIYFTLFPKLFQKWLQITEYYLLGLICTQELVSHWEEMIQCIHAVLSWLIGHWHRLCHYLGFARRNKCKTKMCDLLRVLTKTF
jgi:hypothetical protein